MRNDRVADRAKPISNRGSSEFVTGTRQNMEVGISRVAAVAVFFVVITIIMETHKEEVVDVNDLIRYYSDIANGRISLYGIAVGFTFYGMAVLLCRSALWVWHGFSNYESYTIRRVVKIKHRHFLLSTIILFSMLYVLAVFLKITSKSGIFEVFS